jgi:TonB-linked SusC/RagA family outer membrane protein
MSSTRSGSKLIAFFGRVNYNFKEKYLASIILRHEGSSRFGADHKWGNFPAVSAGWNISKEKFMSSLKMIDNLKLRAGYGITGNQDIPNYQSLVLLGTGGQYLNNGSWFQTYGPTNNPNPDLRWEKKKEFNAGIDFSLFESRISGSVDIYKRKTEDLLANYNTQVPPFVTTTIYTNVGSIENHGIEIALRGLLVKKRDLSWTAFVTFSNQANKLSSISNDVFKASYFEYGSLPAPGSLGNAIRTQEGAPLGQFYGKRFAGFSQDGKWLFHKADGTTGTASQMTTQDLSYIGNGVPKYMASLGTQLTYRNFDLNIFFRGKFGFDVLNMPDMYFGNKKWLGNNILHSALTKHAQLLDDPQYSNYYLEKGDFVKLDNITIGYNFPFHHSDMIRSLRIYASGQNLAVITKYSGLDPEMQDTGLTTGMDNRGFYPQTRTFTLGLNIGF